MVSFLTFADVTGDISMCCMICMVSPGNGTLMGAGPAGKRLKASASGMLGPGQYTRSYLKLDNLSAQRCIRGEII